MNADAFAALPPVPTVIEVGGERIELAPLRVGELPGFARAVQPVASRLSASPDWLALLAEQGEPVIEAVAIAARRPRDWVAGLELDEAVRLADAVFGVNADFFVRRLLPALTAAAERMGRVVAAGRPGPTPSNA